MPAKPVKWEAKAVDSYVTRIAVDLPSIDTPFKMLCQADEHWDHPDCKRHLIARHLDQALELQAPVFKFGDSLCIMQAPMDKRASKGGTRPEHDRKTYLQAVCEDYARWHTPYAGIVAQIGAGNHETKFMRLAGVNPTHQICKEFQLQHGRAPIEGGYTGWIQVQFTIQKTKRITKFIRWHHGSGGTAPVTKGLLKAPRRGLVYPDADVLVQGHTHENWTWMTQRERINGHGTIRRDYQLHVQLPSYKDSLSRKSHGWEVEMEFQPQSVGAYWLEFHPETVESHGIGVRIRAVEA